MKALRYTFALWPSGTYYRLGMVVLALASVCAMILHRGDPGESIGRADHILSLLTIGVAMVTYGAYRAFHYHPATNRVYREWLVLSPYKRWTSLPLGPLQLVGRDLFAVCLFTTFALLTPWIPVWTTGIVFLAAYLFSLARVLALIRMFDGAWRIMMGLAVAAGTIRHAWLSLLILVLTYLVTIPVLRRSVNREFLSSIPRVADVAFRLVRAGLAGNTTQQRNYQRLLRKEHAKSVAPHARALDEGLALYAEEVGWPLAILGPGDIVPGRQSLRLGVAIGMLLAAWLIAILRHIPELDLAKPGITSPEALLCFAVCVGALARLAAYASFMRSPISFAGRFGIGRVVLWPHDCIYLVPCISIVASLIAPRILEAMGTPIPWAIGISVFLCTAILIGGPPTLRTWILTGHFRLAGIRSGLPSIKRV